MPVHKCDQLVPIIWYDLFHLSQETRLLTLWPPFHFVQDVRQLFQNHSFRRDWYAFIHETRLQTSSRRFYLLYFPSQSYNLEQSFSTIAVFATEGKQLSCIHYNSTLKAMLQSFVLTSILTHTSQISIYLRRYIWLAYVCTIHIHTKHCNLCQCLLLIQVAVQGWIPLFKISSKRCVFVHLATLLSS